MSAEPVAAHDGAVPARPRDRGVAPGDPVLRVEGLTIGYVRADGQPNTVVYDASITLRSGRILGLAGESGCGKSTTALAAIGYRAPGARILEGRALLGEIDLLTLSTPQLRSIWGRRVAYVAQSASQALNPAIPVGRQLAQPLSLHLGLRGGALRERQLQLLDAVGLPDPERALARYPHQFSGGQQQRVAIAIALSCRPEVLLLDEPTTGLDVTTQARISALLRSIIDETGVAALYVSHDLSLLTTIADELAVMYAGEIVEHTSAETMRVRPRHPYTQALLAAVPSVRQPRAVSGIPGRPPATVVHGACSFAPRCPHADDETRSRKPELREVEARHWVRCLRAAEIEPETVEQRPLVKAVAGRGELLEVERIFCEYRGARSSATVVKDVSFSLGPAETLGIVGESGSGKSTLLRAIVGLHPPSAGSIRLRGKELPPRAVKRPSSLRKDIQLVFQNPDSSLNPRQTVGEIVGRPIRLFRDDVPRSGEREAIEELLDAVKLPRGMRGRYASELSGGQKQRIALARGFAARPSLLLCDEVTSALDVSVQATILELLAELAETFETAVIFVSHDLAVVRTIATRALVMKDGEVREQGETERLFLSPRDPYTRELLSAIPDLAAEPAAVGGSR
ncbi:MAG: ABC transporter ATP-binding protein [Thermoleophilia bacterium]|nr:ABC transporter ATP-binding protein [Thermoleophilia bacterium]